MNTHKDSEVICLNCGEVAEGRFCKNCGQKTDTARFTMRSFGLHLLSSLTRVSGDFLRTAWGLLRHPWEIVRRYVYGRRAGLVSPVSMLLLLALYWGVLMAIVPHLSQQGNLETMNLGTLLKWLYSSITIQYLILAVPIAFATRIVYRNDLRGRFNFAELLIATLYLACTFLIVDFILAPLELWNSIVGNILIIGITGLYGILSVLKAFPQPSKGRTALKLSLWCAVSLFLLFLLLMLIAFPIYSDYLL